MQNSGINYISYSEHRGEQGNGEGRKKNQRTTGTGTKTRCWFGCIVANCRQKGVIAGCGLTRGKTLRRRGLRISRGRDAHAPSGIRIVQR